MRKEARKLWEKLVERMLLMSSTFTSITILLIVIFLFREGISVFNQSPIEEGFKLAVNSSNPITSLTPSQIKKIFDQELTNWNQAGGFKDSIILFRIDDIGNFYSEEELGENYEFIPKRIDELIQKNPGILAFVQEKYLDKNFNGKIISVKKQGIGAFFSGKEWFPTAQPAAQLGILPLILGTLIVSFGAILFALPLGLATSIYMAEIAPEKIRSILKPVIELLAGIPSVVYGFFGLVVLVPVIQKTFDLPVGETALAGSIILGIMALPTIISVSEDSMRNTPRLMKEASLALGATKWQTIYRVVIPYSMSGITTAAILGIGRAIGETMAVLMVTGNAAIIPHGFLEPVRTIPATIAAELGEAPQGGLHFKALFALGCILFIITLLINVSVEYISSKKNFKK